MTKLSFLLTSVLHTLAPNETQLPLESLNALMYFQGSVEEMMCSTTTLVKDSVI